LNSWSTLTDFKLESLEYTSKACPYQPIFVGGSEYYTDVFVSIFVLPSSKITLFAERSCILFCIANLF